MKIKYQFSLLLIPICMMSCSNPPETKTPAVDSAASKPATLPETSATTKEGVTSTAIAQEEAETPLDQNPDLKAEIEALREQWKDVANPMVASFEGAELGDYFHLSFEDASGTMYDFGNGENDLGDLELYNEDLVNNPKYMGKKFKISWEWKLSHFLCCQGQDNSVVAKVPSITKIELIGK